MIQEKDFLYRVPVKTAPITTPGGQIRNPEILVDVEGGEFMHGNILDANSTNKLINQSVKDAVDDKFTESGYVTKDLLEAETSARTKSDEDLGAKIKAEQTRAEGKEKEISDKLAIVDGDSNTEGSFRKAIADVIAAAPEDLDTLKEIADKLAGNDDLHTALNQAITEKADASALANEVTRATGAESGLQAAIATKADATALSNYVLTTALNQQVDTLNAAISAKQDAGNYITYDPSTIGVYQIDQGLIIKINDTNFVNITTTDITFSNGEKFFTVNPARLEHLANFYKFEINKDGINLSPIDDSDDSNGLKLSYNGVRLYGGDNNHVLTSNASTIDITEYAKKTELPAVPTKTSQLTNDSNFIAAAAVDNYSYTLQRYLKIGNEADDQITIGSDSISSTAAGGGFVLDGSGITFPGIPSQQIPTAGGEFIELSRLANADDVTSLRVGLSKKQDKITVNEVDVTDIETADITKLRTIVTNLINALSASNLIRETYTLE